MTICVSLKLAEGIVVGADSLTSVFALQGNNLILRRTENRTKIIQFSDLPIAALSFGLGNIGARSIRKIIASIKSKYVGDGSVLSVSKFLLAELKETYVKEYYGLKIPQRLGLVVIGYEAGQTQRAYEISIPDFDSPKQLGQSDYVSLNWRGETSAIKRLFHGYDSRLPTLLPEKNWENEVHKVRMPVDLEDMSIRRGIEFVDFLLRMTVNYHQFSEMKPRCGGPIQIATITQEDGLQWISRDSSGTGPLRTGRA